MDLNLKDKIVLITGGSKGLGRAIAHRFASEGCHLHLVARTQETLDEAANALRQQFSVKVGTFAIDLHNADPHSASPRPAAMSIFSSTMPATFPPAHWRQ
jgi:short-subunit dehydrogenase